MKSLAQYLVFVLTVLPFAVAAEQKADRQAVERYISTVGVQQLLDSVPDQIDAMGNQQQNLDAADQDTENHVMQALLHAWDSANMQAIVVDHIVANSDQGEIEQLLQWAQSPLAQRLYQAEEESYQAEFEGNFLRFITEMQSTPPDAARQATIERLVTASELAETMTEMTIKIMGAMAISLAQMDSDQTAETTAAINEAIDQYRDQLQPAMVEQAKLISHYLYRDFSDADLNRYAAHYESSLGKREIALLSESIIAAMSSWADRAGTAIMQLGIFEEEANDASCTPVEDQ